MEFRSPVVVLVAVGAEVLYGREGFAGPSEDVEPWKPGEEDAVGEAAAAVLLRKSRERKGGRGCVRAPVGRVVQFHIFMRSLKRRYISSSIEAETDA